MLEPEPLVVESELVVPDCPLIVPDVPEELPLFLPFDFDLEVVELVVLFWSIVPVLDCPVCDALDCPLGSVPVAVAPEPVEL